jgi:hypothetical protein
MNQSIEKLANLLLARKAIHSLPANTSLTLRELKALVLECQGPATNIAESTTSTAAKKSFSGIRSGIANSNSNINSDEVFYQHRHPHQAPLSIITTKQPSFVAAAAAAATMDTSSFRIAIRQLSSSSASSSIPKQ